MANSKAKQEEFNIDSIRNIQEEDLNEEQSKQLWTFKREQDLKMQQKQGFLPQGFDIKALAKGGKDAKEAAKNFKPVSKGGEGIGEEGEEGSGTPIAEEEKKDNAGDRSKDDFVSSFRGRK